MLRQLLATLYIIAITAGVSSAQQVDATALDTLFNRLERHNKAMGSVLLSKNGHILYQRGFGWSQMGSQTRPNTATTVYRIGSISKMFTASLIFRLIEEKKLSLSDKLSKWYPQLPNADKITIDHLLTHHSGLHNFTDDATFDKWQQIPRTKEQEIALFASQQPDFTPGEKMAYSNTNFVVLGYIIEKITGMSYAKNLSYRLTGPLKLTHTAFGAAIHPEKGEAYPYKVEGGKWVPDEPSNIDVAGAAGGVVSSVGDMARFIEALFLQGYLSKAALTDMTTLKDGAGRGIFQFPFGTRKAWGHNGQIDDFSSMVGFFPNDSVSLSLVCNGINYNFNDIIVNVLSIYYGKPYKMPDFANAFVIAPEKLKKFEGIYSNKEVGMDITIIATQSGITAQATGQGAFPLDPVSDTDFANEQVGVHLNFATKNEEAPTTMILSQGGARIPFTRKN
jgi:D-alanyl-D-alanine carboxypeptidase